MRRRFVSQLLVGLAVFWALAARAFQAVLDRIGTFVYTLDDPYIHMAIARHLAADGAWSINAHGFTGASSSILWPLLLAAVYAVTGPLDLLPLAFNLLAGTAAVAVAAYVFAREGVHPVLGGAALVGMVVLTPLVPVAFTGLGHVLHLALTLAVAYLGAALVARDDWSWRTDRRTWGAFLALLCLSTATRYEGLFLAGVLTGFFALRRRWSEAVQTAVVAWVPAAAYAAVALAHGSYPVPNSIVVKAIAGGQSGLAARLTETLATAKAAPHLTVLVLAAAVLVVALLVAGERWSTATVLLGAFAGATVLHYAFARIGWFFRYEAYLVGFGIVAIAVGLASATALADARPSPRSVRVDLDPGTVVALVAVLVLVAGLAGPLTARAGTAHERTPIASQNIHDQQYQMAQFVEAAGIDTVAANDIGAINYYTSVHTVDLWGLASKRVATAKAHDTYSTATIRRMTAANDVEVAMVYRDWYAPYGGVPDPWVRVATWTVEDNVILGSPTVTFYATEPGRADELRRELCDYRSNLPDRTTMRTYHGSCPTPVEDSPAPAEVGPASAAAGPPDGRRY